MSKFHTIELSVCSDCIQIIANGEIDDGTDAGDRCADRQVAVWGSAVRHLVAGSAELGFSWADCDGCESGLAGDRHQAYALIPA